SFLPATTCAGVCCGRCGAVECGGVMRRLPPVVATRVRGLCGACTRFGAVTSTSGSAVGAPADGAGVCEYAGPPKLQSNSEAMLEAANSRLSIPDIYLFRF